MLEVLLKILRSCSCNCTTVDESIETEFKFPDECRTAGRKRSESVMISTPRVRFLSTDMLTELTLSTEQTKDLE